MQGVSTNARTHRLRALLKLQIISGKIHYSLGSRVFLVVFCQYRFILVICYDVSSLKLYSIFS